MSNGMWSTVDVPAMWISAQAADTQMAWEQVGAWSRTHELLLFHESRLKTLQLELSAAWPPERSPAASAFVQHMDGLLARVVQARNDAARNRDALKLLLESLASAKKDMAQIKQAWDEFEAQQATNPRPYKGQTWQETLNAKAQARMERNDREVFEATQRMVASNLWREPSDDPQKFGESKLNELPQDSERTSGAEGGSPVTSPLGSSATSGGDGSDLAGGQTSNSVLPGTASSPVTPSLSGSDAAPGRFPQAPAMVPVAPALGVSRASVGGPLAQSAGIGGGYRSASAHSAAVVPPQKGAGQYSGSRVNPVGGVISPTSSGVAGMPLIRSNGAGGDDESTRQPAPTLQWEVARGGAPVIEPAVETPFELGPGVIGIDR